ncbi:MAG: winged helix-turn-helix transcriptional regulator [Acholeplasmatales bacterium]|nr:winged helix-turn-helix transcriptional regulator [Acholeplasmatales bacterium]
MAKNEVKEFLDLIRSVKHKINLPSSIEVFLLLELKCHKDLTASMIANKYHVTIPAVMHKLDSLVNDEYLIKTVDEKDKRKKYYHLTPKAEMLLDDNKKIIDNKINNLFDYLGSDKDELIRILNRINEMEEI